MTSKTVAERLRETAENYSSVGLCRMLLRVVTGEVSCPPVESCTECKKGILNTIARQIEAEQRAKAEQNEVDVDTLLRVANSIEYETQHEKDLVEIPPAQLCLWVDRIRNAVNGATFEQAKPQLPEGIEWPRFEDGELVQIGNEFLNNKGNTATVTRIALSEKHFTINKGQGRICKTYGNRIKRPEPEVLDADGVPIKVGDTVYGKDGKAFEVEAINSTCKTFKRKGGVAYEWRAAFFTHHKPDTLESVVSEMVENWYGDDIIDLPSYFNRLRKLMGGE